MKKTLSAVEKLILLAIFISVFKETIVLKVGIIDLKLPQIIWFVIFSLLLLEKAEKKWTIQSISYGEKNNKIVFALYLFIIVISCLFSIDLRQSMKELTQYLYLFFAMYTIYIKAKEKYFFDAIVKVMIGSNVVIIFIAFLSICLGKSLIPTVTIFSNGGIILNNDLYNPQNLIETGNSINRINILGMGPIGMSYYVLLQSLLINYKIRITTGKTRIYLILLLFANSILIIFGYSRIGIILFFVLNIFTLLSKNHLNNVGIICITVIGGYLLLSSFQDVFHRILETFNTEELSSKYHFVFWLIALRTGYNNILTGIGIGNMAYSPGNNDDLFQRFGLGISDVAATHNFILQIWSEQGIIGLLVNMTLIILPITYYVNAKFVRKTIPTRSKFNYMVLGYIGTLIYGLTNNSFYIEIFWEYMGLMYAMKYYLTKDGKLLLTKYIPNCRVTKLRKQTNSH